MNQFNSTQRQQRSQPYNIWIFNNYIKLHQQKQQRHAHTKHTLKYCIHIYDVQNVDDLVQDCNISSAFAMEKLQSHWGRVTHICVTKLTIIGSDNGLSPGRRQAIIWTNAGILLIRPLGTNFNEMLIEILAFSKCRLRNGVHFVSASMC